MIDYIAGRQAMMNGAVSCLRVHLRRLYCCGGERLDSPPHGLSKRGRGAAGGRQVVGACHTRIVRMMVVDPDLCKQASELLLEQHGVCLQPINYPTVPRELERLRIAPGPFHDACLITASRALCPRYSSIETIVRRDCKAGSSVLLGQLRQTTHINRKFETTFSYS